MELAIQGSIWLAAGVTLVMLLSRRRKRRPVRWFRPDRGWRGTSRS